MTTLLDARTALFARSGIAPDGGYKDRWVHLKVGPIPLVILNTETRRDAVRFHDLHHVLTGYKTDWPGEFEISAWEIATGCADKSFAWIINLQGLAAGTLSWPRRTFVAFVRGLRSRNLYRASFDDTLLATDLESKRVELGLLHDGHNATALETRQFLVWAAIAWLGVLGPFAALVALGSWLFAA
ncbi:MAG: hypothetical protein JKY37_01750 [Nannocystaceae bacterium]|nr:hypothetical protein [Nannocystaceae bacterium]